MATRRVEGDHRNSAVANTTQPLAPQPVVQVKQSAAVADAAPAGYLDFDGLVDGAQRTSDAPQRSPRQWIADFVEPRMADPVLLQSGRSLSILERLASDIIPALDEGEELRSLAGAIISDEIERHRELAARLHGGIIP
jgi:queuine/archaeosine tRNA-ribosyltransferase